MRYTAFTVENYRAIVGPITIGLSKNRLMPIIGVNESGKTTILHAIFAFDHFNDDLNDGGRHLKDTSNLYRSSSPAAVVSADVELSPSEWKASLLDCERENSSLKLLCSKLKNRRNIPAKLTLRRNIVTKKYLIPDANAPSAELQDLLARKLITRLPYTLYFDDFRDKILERIEIPSKEDEDEPLSDWLAILQQLFRQTDKSFSVFSLASLEVRQRRTVLAKVKRHLNETLTKEWQTFRLDDRDALKISIEFEQEGTSPIRNYIKLDVVETDQSGDEHFFFISDRSKGFYWFFNFVMKLEFNPKVVASGSDSAHSIYLLDEPGSYLHAFAQRKLCTKLRQISEKNTVIYCTHSHYLLDPDTIPISCIVVADKDGNGDVDLTRMIDYKGSVTETRSALQPVLDALQIKPYALDLIHAKTTIIVEGIYDFFALELLKGNRQIAVLPSVGASSIKFYVSLMIAWQVKFRALWDHDTEGKKMLADAKALFGDEIASLSFRLLPAPTQDAKRILQDLFSGADLKLLKEELGLSSGSSFERTIQSLFYSARRQDLVGKLSSHTQEQFDTVFDSLSLES